MVPLLQPREAAGVLGAQGLRAPVPNRTRKGGSGASTIARRASAVAAGSPGVKPPASAPAYSACRAWAYAGSCGTCGDAAARPVGYMSGSIKVTWMPTGRPPAAGPHTVRRTCRARPARCAGPPLRRPGPGDDRPRCHPGPERPGTVRLRGSRPAARCHGHDGVPLVHRSPRPGRVSGPGPRDGVPGARRRPAGRSRPPWRRAGEGPGRTTATGEFRVRGPVASALGGSDAQQTQANPAPRGGPAGVRLPDARRRGAHRSSPCSLRYRAHRRRGVSHFSRPWDPSPPSTRPRSSRRTSRPRPPVPLHRLTWRPGSRGQAVVAKPRFLHGCRSGMSRSPAAPAWCHTCHTPGLPLRERESPSSQAGTPHYAGLHERGTAGTA